MKLEAIRLKNFRTFKDAEIKAMPRFCVLVGANGVGKSTIFSVFDFLKNLMTSNVNIALSRIGGNRGFREVRSRNSTGPIEIELKFRQDSRSPLATYFLQIDERNGRAYVVREVLKYRRGSKGQPWHFLDFADGKGTAVSNEASILNSTSFKESDLKRSEQRLKSNDILAVKGLAQFDDFPVVRALGDLIENWCISDFHINKAREEQTIDLAEHLSREGENLSLVLQFLHDNHRDVFDRILKVLGRRVPGVTSVEPKATDEGKILLKFSDGAFEDPFLARFVSDGTIKMLAYLVLLNDPHPFPLLCVEEPENQLYPELLSELAEEFRLYANKGGQVMVSTHSPDFLNAAELDEVFVLVKRDGYTTIRRLAEDRQIAAYVRAGDQLGYLWKQGFFPEAIG